MPVQIDVMKNILLISGPPVVFPVAFLFFAKGRERERERERERCWLLVCLMS